MASLFNELMQHLFNPEVYIYLENDIKQAVNNIVDYPVYDISNVIPLFSEIQNEHISKRPPHTHMWVEWRTFDGVMRFTYLVLLVNVPKESVLDGDFGDDVWEEVKDADELYTSVVFKRYDGGGIPLDEEPLPPIGEIFQENHHLMYGLNDNGVKISHVLMSATDEQLRELSLYRLPWGECGCKDKKAHDILVYAPFVAFSLLHCKNIKVVEVVHDEALQSSRRRKGKLPLYGYHVLKLNVPVEEEHKVYGVMDSEDRAQIRHHMVRGHFKNLQHERFKHKGLYWWPAHWRGNPELGIVEKEYKIETDPRIKLK